jgi:hypothetical protein
MANRTTVKSNVTTKNVPTVTNAILTDILNNDMCDNVKFREDVAVSKVAGVSGITVDFTGIDRVDLQRTGGSLNITVSGIGDGETKFLLITKTAGQVVTWVGVTDVTDVKPNADALSVVTYEIIRKGSNFYARAVAETVILASDAEAQGLTEALKVLTPATNPIASTGQTGLVKIAGAGEIAAGTDSASGKGNVYCIPPSALKTVKDAANTAIGTKQNRIKNIVNFGAAPAGQHSGTVIAVDYATVDVINLTSNANGFYAMPDPGLYPGLAVYVHNNGSGDKALDLENIEQGNKICHIYLYGTAQLMSNGAKWVIISINSNVSMT